MGSKRITEEQRQQMAHLALAGLKQCEISRKLGISKSPVSAHLMNMKMSEVKPLDTKKEPAAEISTSEQNKIPQYNNSAEEQDCQALRGTDLLGVLQTMLENAYGKDAAITYLNADSDTASISFTYGGESYSLLFGKE